MKTHMLLKSTSKLALLSLASAVLAGCGGSGGITPAPPPQVIAPTMPTTPPASSSLDVAGTVNGLDGEVVIVVNGESLTQDVNGGFEFTDLVTSGDDVTISLTSDPFGQTCAVTGSSTRTNVTSNITDVVIDCVDVPVINTKVKNFLTGESIDAAEVTLTRQDGGATISESVTVNDDGVAAFEVPLSAGRLIFSTDPDGFSAQTIIVETPETAETILADLFVQVIDFSTTFDNTAGQEVLVGTDSLLTIPANGFVDANGEQVVGNISMKLTVIDPSQSIDLMPGEYLAQNPANNEITQIESFGALDMAFEDSAGNPVQLADDVTATIRIPVANRVSAEAPNSIPLYFFNKDTGFWVEEGSADLMTLTSGEQAYEGTVPFLTTWNADRPTDTVQATGCVVDSIGQAVSGVRIRSEGADYIGSSRATSDSRGDYSIPLRVDSSQFISAFRAFQSRTLTVASGSNGFAITNDIHPTSCLVVSRVSLGANSATVTLTWGENPRDLDTFFYGRPEVESADNTPFQIAYFRRDVTVNGETIFLDVDDTSSFGPEILTVPSFPYEGVYTYGIDLFAGTGTIASSLARVEVNLGGDVTVYGPPEGEPTRCWAVMRFIVDSEGNVTRETIGTWEAREYCTDGTGIAGSNGGFGKTDYGPVDSENMKPEPVAADLD